MPCSRNSGMQESLHKKWVANVLLSGRHGKTTGLLR